MSEVLKSIIHRQYWTTASMKRMLVFTMGTLMILIVPMILLRHYQSSHLKNLFQKYSNTAIERLPLKQQSIDNNSLLITSHEQIPRPPKGVLTVDYMMAEFNPERCGYSTIWPILRYERLPYSGTPDFSRTISINLERNSTNTKVFFPIIVYNEVTEIVGAGTGYFKGIEVSKDQAECLRGLYRVRKPTQLPILLTMSLSPSWEQTSLYQKITAWETNNIYTVPQNMSPDTVKGLIKQPLKLLKIEDLSFRDNIVSNSNDQWLIKGYATPQRDPYDYALSDRTHSQLARVLFADVNTGQVDTDLIKTKDIKLKKGNTLIAKGKLYAGGITFGLVKDGLASGYVNVTARGPFTAVIEVPEDGMYSLGIANNFNGYTSLENRLVLTKLGFIKSDNMIQ
jgi:hypothetical protein